MRDERSLGGRWIFWSVVALFVLGVGLSAWLDIENGGPLAVRSGLLFESGLLSPVCVLAVLAIVIAAWSQFELRQLRDEVDQIIEYLEKKKSEARMNPKKIGPEVLEEVRQHRDQLTKLKAEAERLRFDVEMCVRSVQAQYREDLQRTAKHQVELSGKVIRANPERAFPGELAAQEPSRAPVSFPQSTKWEVPVEPRPTSQTMPGRYDSPVPATLQPPTLYFASVPEEDGSFKDLKEREEYDALYKLTLHGSPEQATSATVDLCLGSDGVKAAIQLPNRYLSPVCSYDANPQQGDSGIIQDRPGRAERSGPGQRWRIKDNEKLRIRFR